MSVLGERLKYVTIRVWSDLPAAEWPELPPSPTAVAGLDRRDNLGVAFSGGGTRSAAATLGQLRALRALGWMDRLRYIAAVSGGAWTAVPFTFLPSSRQDETFLGASLEPEDIRLADLDDLDLNSFAHVVSQSTIADDLLRHLLAGDELLSRVMGDVFLKPVGLDPTGRLFTQDSRSLASILERNTDLTSDDFHLARAGRPFLISTGTVLRAANDNPGERRFRFDMTPLYLGIRELFPTAGSKNRPIGGGFVEPCGFDSDAPDENPVDGIVDVRLGLRHRFTLSDVVGTTGAAPAWALAKLGLNFFGFPEFKYWSPSMPAADEKEYEFGDGGNLENLAIMPLLARKVARIVVFVNTNHRLVPNQYTEVADSLPPLFGTAPDGFMLNHVFPDGRFRPLMDALWARAAEGGPAWHREAYEVLENRHHGVDGGWQVDVTWVYNHMPSAWHGLLRPEVRALVGHGELGNFPHYETFFQNARVIDLSARQTSLLAHMSCWACREALVSAESPDRGRRSRGKPMAAGTRPVRVAGGGRSRKAARPRRAR
jgi:hypothetical protein